MNTVGIGLGGESQWHWFAVIRLHPSHNRNGTSRALYLEVCVIVRPLLLEVIRCRCIRL